MHRFPCPSCGSGLRFDAAQSQLLCDHCGYTEPVVQRRSDGPSAQSPWGAPAAQRPKSYGALDELDYAAAVAGGLPESQMETTRVTHCDTCGAEVELGPDLQARTCPFCASPLVGDTGDHRHIKPQAVLPFALPESEARTQMTKWLGRLWFAPNGLKDYARKGRRMQGIYVPYWTFDAATRSRYSGARGDAYTTTETRMVKGEMKRVQVRKIRWRNVSGTTGRDFDDVLALASKSLPQTYTDALEPWDLDGLLPYQPDYLAGYRAEGYQIGLEDGFGIAKSKMDAQIRIDVQRDIGGDQQRIHRIETDTRNVTFKHILLPVWLAAYKFRGQTYRFVVNARTGEVKGERPWSVAKIAIAVILALLIAGALLTLGSLPS